MRLVSIGLVCSTNFVVQTKFINNKNCNSFPKLEFIFFINQFTYLGPIDLVHSLPADLDACCNCCSMNLELK